MITFGASVGTGSSTGSQSVTVTLTADVDAGTPLVARYIALEVSTEFSAIVGTDDFTIDPPNITLNPPQRSSPYRLANYLIDNIGAINQGALIDTGPPFTSGDWINAPGMYPLIIVSPMRAGDTITLDFTGQTTRTLQKLYVKARVCEGVTAVASPRANGIFYGYVFGGKSTSGHLYIPGNSAAPAAPPYTFFNGKQLLMSGCTSLDSEDMSVQIIGGDSIVPDFFDQHINPGSGVTGFAFYRFPALVSTAMNYQWSGTARRNTYGFIQLVEGPGLPYPDVGAVSFDDVVFPQ